MPTDITYSSTIIIIFNIPTIHLTIKRSNFKSNMVLKCDLALTRALSSNTCYQIYTDTEKALADATITTTILAA